MVTKTSGSILVALDTAGLHKKRPDPGMHEDQFRFFMLGKGGVCPDCNIQRVRKPCELIDVDAGANPPVGPSFMLLNSVDRWNPC